QSQPNAGEPKGYGGDQFLLEWHGLRAGERALLGSDPVVHIADIASACESVALGGLWNRVSIKLELHCSKWPATAEITSLRGRCWRRGMSRGAGQCRGPGLWRPLSVPLCS